MPVPPQNVVSPISRLGQPLTVVHTVPDWSLATAFWDGQRALLIRWNGDANRPLGNPVSHAQPTWFVLPEDLHWAVLSAAEPERRLEAINWLSAV